MICALILNIRLKTLTILLTFFALFNGAKWASHFAQSPYSPLDFRTYYFSAKAYWNGDNPYQDSAQIKQLQQYPNPQEIQIKTPAGFPHASAVYAPQFVWYFGLYNLLDYPMAKWLDFFLNIAAIGLIIRAIKRLNPSIHISLIASGLLSFRGIWYALDTGQPMLQVLCICLWAFVFYRDKKYGFLPSLLFAWVSFKFTLLLPFVCLMFLGKNKRPLLMYLSLLVAFNCLALLVHPDAEWLLQAWSDNMNKLWAYPHQYLSLNGINTISSNLSVPLVYRFNIPLLAIKPTMTIVLLSSYFLVWLKNKTLSDAQILLFLGLSNVCFGQHLIYDVLMVIVFKLMTLKPEKTLGVGEIILLLFLTLPMGSLAERLNFPALHFGLNTLLFFQWMVLLWIYFFSKNKTTKNTN